ncbi:MULTISPECIES: hypothetical protein [unclassified Aureimonas]|uniref:hypothetical protein n=1 Tax=unclassified Aureimonas TaxID=2615206 RepID=UPI000701F1C3|nr:MULTISPECIES: hypothetical protein [unclassified Aureimonas]KQT52285.1 hypothetical protein ASG62_16665 [Aureimonas sp. Leaf427]KQT61829.1 hypothetical protein ASG54_23680 [Aureimonas sp. Leaf460]
MIAIFGTGPGRRPLQPHRLTGAARARLPEACTVLFQSNDEALAGFTTAEVEVFNKLLERLIANLDHLVRNDVGGQ